MEETTWTRDRHEKSTDIERTNHHQSISKRQDVDVKRFLLYITAIRLAAISDVITRRHFSGGKEGLSSYERLLGE